MLLCSVDASTRTASVALTHVHQGKLRPRAQRSELLRFSDEPTEPLAKARRWGRVLGLVEELVGSCGLRLDDVEAYAVGTGPGLTDGLRASRVLMQDLARTFRRPLVGASSLEAMSACGGATLAPGLHVPILETDDGALWAGFYRVDLDGGLREVMPPSRGTPADLLRTVEVLTSGRREAYGYGTGYQAHLGSFFRTLRPLPSMPWAPTAFGVAQCAVPKLSLGLSTLSAVLSPTAHAPAAAQLNW